MEVLASPSLFFTGMAGSRLPIAVAHGEGYADFSQRGDAAAVQRAMRFVDTPAKPTEAYPANPNGSPDGLTAVTTADGRFTVLMPHPEFNEELGAVDPGTARAARYRHRHTAPLTAWAATAMPSASSTTSAASKSGAMPRRCSARSLRDLQQAWDEVSWRIARLRDNPECADAEHAAAGADADDGLARSPELRPGRGPRVLHLTRPKVAILREQGVNSQVEMSYAMAQAGFDTFDVHMSDLQSGRARLDQFQAFVACGGFSYGDTLGAGEGWARSILFNPVLAEMFAAFFNRADTFRAGRVQRLPDDGRAVAHHSRRRGLAQVHAQPQRAVRGALSLVEVLASPSLFFTGMAGSRLPIAVAHGEGFADFSQRGDAHGGAARDALRRNARRNRPRPIRPTRTAAPTA